MPCPKGTDWWMKCSDEFTGEEGVVQVNTDPSISLGEAVIVRTGLVSRTRSSLDYLVSKLVDDGACPRTFTIYHAPQGVTLERLCYAAAQAHRSVTLV